MGALMLFAIRLEEKKSLFEEVMIIIKSKFNIHNVNIDLIQFTCNFVDCSVNDIIVSIIGCNI